jgi:hypothetical protein
MPVVLLVVLWIGFFYSGIEVLVFRSERINPAQPGETVVTCVYLNATGLNPAERAFFTSIKDRYFCPRWRRLEQTLKDAL